MRVAWDSTTLGTLEACPRKYYYMYELNLRTRDIAIDLDFGILYHKALELWERFGADEAALHKSIRNVLSRKESESLRDLPPTHPKGIFALLRAVVWYTCEYATDSLQTMTISGKLALETNFKLAIGDYFLCGHLDRVVTWRDRIWFTDRKTTKKTLNQDWFGLLRLSRQMDSYWIGTKIAFNTEAAGGIIEGVQLGVNFARFGRGIIERSPTEVTESLREIENLLESAESYYAQGFFPRNKQACFLCGFKDLCSRPEKVRQAFIKDMLRADPWDPLIPREQEKSE